MTNDYHLPFVGAIRKALEEIPDAILDESPVPENVERGFDPAAEILRSMPEEDELGASPDVQTHPPIMTNVTMSRSSSSMSHPS
jgi:hypothetical protein